MNDHFLLKVNHPNLCSSRITSSLGQALGYRRSQQQYRSRFDINPTSYLRFSASNSQFAARLDVVGGGYGRIECSGHRCRCRSADEQHADNEAGGGQSFIFRPTAVDRDIAVIALPALATLAADPIASLVDTAYIARLGAVQLAAVGTALSVFNTATKLFNVPLLAVTTSLVATAEGGGGGQKTVSAASAAVAIALAVGLIQAAVLLALGNAALTVWGASPTSALRADAAAFLLVRAAGAPATVLLLVLQGVFRGLGDTRTPLQATLASNALNIVLDPVFIFALRWGVTGAASATVLAEAAAAVGLLVMLTRRYPLTADAGDAIKRSAEFLGPTGLLALRSVAISGTFAVATSIAARTDPIHAAAHQICIQLWLASSLLADALAVAAQSLMAKAIAAGDRATARFVARRSLGLGLLLGVGLGAALQLGSGARLSLFSLPRAFSPDAPLLAAVYGVFPFVALTQPLNSLAFVWDGVLYGTNGFAYAARSMAVCAAVALAVMSGALAATGRPEQQLGWVWGGLATLMAMRSLTIYVPFRTRRPPFDGLFGGAEDRGNDWKRD